MIGRLMLSLRKAADPSRDGWPHTTYIPSSRCEMPIFAHDVEFASISDDVAVTSTEEDIHMGSISSRNVSM